MKPIGVLGAGSWGTALATHAGSAGLSVELWARDRELAREMETTRRNTKYLPEADLGPSVRITSQLEDLARLSTLLVVVPSHGFRDIVTRLVSLRDSADPLTLVSATKGIETESLSRMSEVVEQIAEESGIPIRYAVLSGPTFAAELAVGQPSAAVIASSDHELASELGRLLSTERFRLYSSDDVVGVELGGATKNVIAIGAGIVTGLGLGHNTLAALITRGLHEISRLGVACGGEIRTLSGLAGLGDLVLTCTGGLSRNRRTGMALASGKTVAEIESETSMVAEGIRNSLSVTRLARRQKIEMPITEQMMAVLYEGKPSKDAVRELMTRSLKSEAAL
jgi:glycerol-3-phosphate dehydrogenase (NAD(P)+)